MQDDDNEDELWSRARLAGYDPGNVEFGRVVVVGGGAIGTNTIQTLALSGVGDIAICDMDHVERSNLARSPLFRTSDAGLSKAKVAAERAQGMSPYPDALMWYAEDRIERLGLGAFEDASVVVSAVDSVATRAYLADTTRLLGIPLVEAGFDGFVVHASVWQNRRPDAPCYRCLDSSASPARASCSLYAEAVKEAGYLPAIQSAAAVAANLAAEAAIQAMHLNYPLDEYYLEFDVRSGSTKRVRVARLETCPGAHARLPEPRRVPLTNKATVERLLANRYCLGAALTLREPFVVSAPCGRCGAVVAVRRPMSLATLPECATCLPRSGPPAELTMVSTLDMDHELAGLALTELGYGPRDVAVLEREGETFSIRLHGAASLIWKGVLSA